MVRQTGTLVDNPDQRINDDVAAFTGAALSFTLVLFNSAIDLASFSGILYSIYPPLFAALLVYAIGCACYACAVSCALRLKCRQVRLVLSLKPCGLSSGCTGERRQRHVAHGTDR
jgi:ABC-type uncharacterized transport system fused permease/ATPase subunit